jgi:tetratricopeptide (TPR) repeat protein
MEHIFADEQEKSIEKAIEIGEIYTQKGEYKEAFDVFNKCIKDGENKFSGENFHNLAEKFPVFAKLYNSIAVTYLEKGKQSENGKNDFEKAVYWLEKSISVYEKHCNKKYLDYAFKYYTNFKLNQIIKTFAEEFKDRVINNFTGLSDAYCNLSQALENLGDLKNALSYAEKSLDILENLHDTDNLKFAEAKCQIGHIYIALKKFEKAISLYEDALRIHETILGKDHIKSEYILENLTFLYGLTYFEEEEAAVADNFTKRWFSIRELQYGTEQALLDYANIGANYLQCNAQFKAEEVFDDVLHKFETNYGDLDQKTIQAYTNIAVTYEKYDEYDCAADIYSKIGKRLEENKMYNQAKGWYLAAIRNTKLWLGEKHPDLPDTLVSYGKKFIEFNDLKTAHSQFADVAEIINNQIESGDFDFIYPLDELAEYAAEYNEELIKTAAKLYNLYGLKLINEHEYMRAETYYNKSLELCKQVFGGTHKNTAIVLINIGNSNLNYVDWARSSVDCDSLNVIGFYERGLRNFYEALEILGSLSLYEDSLTVILSNRIKDLEIRINDETTDELPY